MAAFASTAVPVRGMFGAAPAAAAAPCCGRPGLPCVAPPPRRAALRMEGLGNPANLTGKAGVIDTVEGLLADSSFLFSAPLPGLTVAQVSQLKNSMPESTKVMIVKNTLMRKAIAGSSFESAESLTSGSNMWFFVQGDIKETVEPFKAFAKANKLKSFTPLGGVLDGEVFDNKGVLAIAEMPSKQELYGKIASLIQMVPTKVARSVKAVPTKLGRAIKLAKCPDDDDGEPASA